MDKIKSAKRIGIAVAAITAGVALTASAAIMATPVTVKAATVNPTQLFSGTVADKATYGKTFSVPEAPSGASVKVFSPDGEEVTKPAAQSGAYDIVADQVGNYKVKYYATDDENAQYVFNVYVTLDKEYFLKVDDNGAGIPTYIKKDGEITLPNAGVYYYDDNKILQRYPSQDVTLTIKDSLSAESHAAGDKITVTNSGKLYITYSAEVKAGGKKYLSETFTTTAKADFSDTQSPSLTVSGITSSASINKAITLPTATVSDDYDEHPLVSIKVTDPDGNAVKNVDVDEDGYAYQAQGKTYDEVKFDNKDVMTFYPTKAGTYKVEYYATDDAGNKSSTKSWTIAVGDSVAPVFKNASEWEYKLPQKWGVAVTKAASATVDAKIYLPIPDLIDNKDHVVPLSDEDKDLISLYVRITDSDYSRDILTFNNVMAKVPTDDTTGECQATNEVYASGAKQTFSRYNNDTTPFAFDFSEYKRKDKDGNDVDLAGKYTIYYRASDAAGNRASKTYTIDLAATYADADAPTIDDIDLPDYISYADTEFTIPSVVVSDAASSTLKLDYKIYSSNGLASEEGKQFITVSGGEKAVIEARTESGVENLYLILNKGKSYEKSLLLKDKVYFCATATDAVGNIKSNGNSTTSSIALDGTNFTTCTDFVTIIDRTAISAVYAGNIEFKTADYDSTGELSAFTAKSDVKTGEIVNAGGFTITLTDPNLRKYVGYEISVKTGDDYVETRVDTYTTYDTTAVIYVNNIRFTPNKAGDHYLNVRVFDVNGKSSCYTYKTAVTEATASGGTVKPSAVVLPDSNAEVNTKYTLHKAADEYAGGTAGSTYWHARQIRGKAYSLMGNEFVAKTQSGYSVSDGFVEDGKTSSFDPLGADFLPDGSNNGKYSFSVTDSVSPVIEVQGVMPTYAKKSTTDTPVLVTIPSVIAYSANGPAEVKIEVTFSGEKIETTKVTGTNTYTFEGKKDGVYTIKVTANRADATETSASYEVNIGDVIPPEFTVSGDGNYRATQNDTFTFKAITLAAGESSANVTITKKLYDPSGSEVTAAAVSGAYDSYKDKENNGTEIKLDKSGTYKVVYTAKDAIGNEGQEIVYVTVAASGSATPTTFTTLSTVLIIIAVVLLAGVIVYVVRFRKVKK